MSNQGQYVTTAISTVGVVGGAYCAYQCYKQLMKPRLPTEWKKVGTLKELMIYPIKSCAPIFLTSAECTTLGLRDGWLRDRVLMIIDQKNNFITARAYPELLLVYPTVRSSILSLKHKDMETVYLNLAEVVALGKVEQAKVWGVTVPVFDCGKEVSEWISKLLNRPDESFRLAYYASQSCRDLRLTSTDKVYKFTKNDSGAFPDEVSYNLVNEASVQDLNGRLKESTVTHHNFRGNFLLSGAEPYAEDNWKYVKIGDNVFEVIKPCFRCVLTTIDPETGIHNPKTEPIETLKSYRQEPDPVKRKAAGSSPRMGLQMALRSAPGTSLSVNDDIYVA
ncbi:mitochondrial amidoxime-reducing component 1 [Aricia agestis]|uniref:mitochondrial amidoxime-reducing component 1 n=1 Tax=Aricia agestis TaxID=91739 RepID=UPI001C2032E6|nr:mitochondrial amidoxime-reducing component 1 [Aricia agestis]